MTCPHCGSDTDEPPAPPKKRRSVQANNYYRGVVIELLAEHFGYTNDEMHDAMKLKFRSRFCPSTGLTIVKSTKTDSPDFWVYVEDIRRWAATWPSGGIYIPEPNEQPGWIEQRQLADTETR